jgi:hypothetical protein
MMSIDLRNHRRQYAAEQPVAAEAAKRVSYRSLSVLRGPAERER